LIIRYYDEDYIIERYSQGLPKLVQELSSPLRNEYFDELENWILSIDESMVIFKTRPEIRILR
jgi:hypothetical protein|tara:strand:- start:607 stop:795 length:189 start_codon:yes stop_codon:yes gene_type:complete